MAQTEASKKAAPKKATAKKATAPKAPQDHKEKGEDVPRRPEDTPGFDLLVPFSEVPVWDQVPLIQLLDEAIDRSDTEKMSPEEFAALTVEEREAIKAEEAEKGEKRNFDLSVISTLTLKLREFAVNEAEYTKFCSGSGAMQRSMDLAMAWVGQMGESDSSEDS